MTAPIIPESTEETPFIEIAYNKFFDLFKEIEAPCFWDRCAYFRLNKIRDIFSIYNELITYTDLKDYLDHRKTLRESDSVIGKQLFGFIRHLLAHFPLFDSWREFYVSRKLITWEQAGRQTDKFLEQLESTQQLKFRFYDFRIDQMVHIAINPAIGYKSGRKIILEEILKEQEGVRFAIRFMLSVLIEKVEDRAAILAELRDTHSAKRA